MRSTVQPRPPLWVTGTRVLGLLPPRVHVCKLGCFSMGRRSPLGSYPPYQTSGPLFFLSAHQNKRPCVLSLPHSLLVVLEVPLLDFLCGTLGPFLFVSSSGTAVLDVVCLRASLCLWWVVSGEIRQSIATAPTHFFSPANTLARAPPKCGPGAVAETRWAPC